MLVMTAHYPDREEVEYFSDLQLAAQAADDHRARGALSIEIKIER